MLDIEGCPTKIHEIQIMNKSISIHVNLEIISV